MERTWYAVDVTTENYTHKIMRLSFLLLFLLAILTLRVNAQSDVEVTTHEDTPLERQGKAQMERLLQIYALDKWQFTDKVVIQSYVIPHSHPVLTLNTRYLDNDVEQLSTYLHEQIHWYADAHEEQVDEIITVFKSMYPEVPVGNGQGARTTESSYLHLLVCWLELDGLGELIGKKKDQENLAAKTYYQWIAKTVLEDTGEIGRVVKEHNLRIK